ncbi:MAG TPA: RagB/SusD family nutrient uptake outer membrane protein [Bacteroidetes bacterium]|nr:RagB/SusD family nutrient uptake outer membrane protein [Bacteroidota bacterium]
MDKMKYIIRLTTIVIIVLAQSCSEGFLDEFPSNSQSPDNIKTVADAQIVLNGAYNLLQDNNYLNANLITDNDCRSDDMQTAEWGRIDDEYLYNYTAQTDMDFGTWAQPYEIIRHVNMILSFIEDIETTTTEEDAEKLDIIGQALAIRAMAHFDLCRMFGRQYSHDNGASLGVPIVTEILNTDAKVKRSTVAEVYSQVIKDLNAAIPLLTEERRLGKINAWAAKTLLARVYLYMEDNTNAYNTAVDIINNGPYELVSRDEYVDSWSNANGSSESIFSIINTGSDNGGGESVNNLADPDGYGQFIASQDLIDLIRSDPDDMRNEMLYYDQTSTDDPNTWGRVLKYPGNGNTKAIIVAHHETGAPLVVSAYAGNVSVFRLSEVYLIAAEAAIKKSTPDQENAAFYLNAIVERGNPAATVAVGDVNLDRILTERRKELCAEGHRFFDLIRNKRDIVRSNSPRIFDNNTPLLIEWDYYKVIFPIPQAELNINPLIQNDGYI